VFAHAKYCIMTLVCSPTGIVLTKAGKHAPSSQCILAASNSSRQQPGYSLRFSSNLQSSLQNVSECFQHEAKSDVEHDSSGLNNQWTRFVNTWVRPLG